MFSSLLTFLQPVSTDLKTMGRPRAVSRPWLGINVDETHERLIVSVKAYLSMAVREEATRRQPFFKDGRHLCEIVRSRARRKTFSLEIREGDRIVCRVPYRAPAQAVEKFILEKWSWVEKKLSQRRPMGGNDQKAFVSGETFLFLGEAYPLEIVDGKGKTPLELTFGRFILRREYVPRGRSVFVEWYKKEARKRLAERLRALGEILSLRPTSLRITSARTRWGSCSRRNGLSITWRIMMAPLEVVDYLLIHELCHIREKNHSPRFWSLVEQVLPDYKERKRWLRQNGHRLTL